MNPFDVAIIGGGPAGSTAAILLARQGRRVVVLEKERFPRFHIGESLLPYNLPLFDELGIREQVESAGFMRKYGARFCLADGSRSSSVRFGDGRFTEIPMAYQVERSAFDEILLRRAAECGADVREQTAVAGYRIEPDGVTVDVAGGAEPIRARFLIDASGQANLTANREGIRRLCPNLRKVAVFGHFRGIPLPDGPEQGDIIIFRLDNAWFWFIPLSREKVSLGLVVDRSDLKGRDPEAVFDEAINRSPALLDRVGNRELVDRLRTMVDFSYTNDRMVSDRLVRIGDAAGFLDPIFSSGVYLAMVSASIAAPAVGEALDAGVPVNRALHRYERKLRRVMRAFRKMIDGFYTRPFMELLMQPEPRFSLPAAVNATLAGRIDTPWGLRWRMRAFHSLVKLQSRFPVVPRFEMPRL